MGFSSYAAQALLNSLLGKASNFGALATRPTIYVALSSTDPGEDGAGITEPAGAAGYARKATAAADWNAATAANPSVATNANQLDFPTATADWLAGANIAYLGLFDAAAAGNFLAKGTITVPKAFLNGDTPSFPADSLQISQE